jgi:hypothetical protein
LQSDWSSWQSLSSNRRSVILCWKVVSVHRQSVIPGWQRVAACLQRRSPYWRRVCARWTFLAPCSTSLVPHWQRVAPDRTSVTTDCPCVARALRSASLNWLSGKGAVSFHGGRRFSPGLSTFLCRLISS